MTEPEPKNKDACRPAKCKGGCPTCMAAEEAEKNQDPSAPRGWRLSTSALAVFLLPLLLALAGAQIGKAIGLGDHQGLRLLMALGGLVLGVVVAIVYTRWIRLAHRQENA